MATSKPGEKKLLILQTLASMLENPKTEKITTATLAARIGVSEAALYRHFASKAQMFEGLIDFIENSVFGLINQIAVSQEHGQAQAQEIMLMLLEFSMMKLLLLKLKERKVKNKCMRGQKKTALPPYKN